uniref:Serpentine receptor class gamma n=1 Tax=Haemonchus contortus TaxID=6289 RepID=A0A7I4YNS8_HAECO
MEESIIAEEMAINILQTVLEAFICSYYTFILVTIATSREKVFCSAFYILFVSTGIADITSLLLLFVLRLNTELSMGTEFRYIILYCIIFSRAAYLGHMIGNTFITFNRYSSICMMHMYGKIWKRRNVSVIIFAQYAVSIVAVAYTAKSNILYSQNEDGTYKFQGLEPHVAKIVGSTSSTIAAVCSLTSLVFNVKLYVAWRNLLRERDRSTTRNAEKGLLMYALAAFTVMMVMSTGDALFTVASTTENRELFRWINDRIFWINDFMVAVPPIFLLLLSSDLRRAILSIFRPPKPPTFVAPVSRRRGEAFV